MTSQQQIEIGFWRDLLRRKGTPEAFLDQRREDWEDFAKNIPELAEFLKDSPAARVLEVGCGLISPLEFSEGTSEIIAIDPLVNAYQDTLDLMGRRVRYQQADGEAIPYEGEKFDAVVCLNVIDHTPDPKLMLSEIKRVMKTGGKLFFGVNYDPALSPAHYGLWNDECVADAMKDFKLVTSRKDERPDYGQTRYWAVYEK
jgi:SAM-dependent methyltransferase